jgi:hypothetical protein
MRKPRDPTWRYRLALGRKVTRDKTRYTRKVKHKPRRPRRGSAFRWWCLWSA